MRIQNNIAAMTAHRNMSVSNAGNARSQEKLSSGLRINRAGDDAAGLSISEKMRGQIRGLNQASRNAQDGISLLQTAEGALNETQNILQRMRELAVQASNDTNTESDRAAIGAEIAQLFEEIDRIAETTQFNEMNLLNGNFGCNRSVPNAETPLEAPSTALVNERSESIAETLANQITDIDDDNWEDLNRDMIDAAFDELLADTTLRAALITDLEATTGIAAGDAAAILDDTAAGESNWSSFLTAIEAHVAADADRVEAREAALTLMRTQIEAAVANVFENEFAAYPTEATELESIIRGLGVEDTHSLFTITVGVGTPPVPTDVYSGTITNSSTRGDTFELEFDFSTQSLSDFLATVPDALATVPPNSELIGERTDQILEALLDNIPNFSGAAIGQVTDDIVNSDDALRRIDDALLDVLFEETFANLTSAEVLAFVNDAIGAPNVLAADVAGIDGATDWDSFLSAVAAENDAGDPLDGRGNALIDAVGELMQAAFEEALSAWVTTGDREPYGVGAAGTENGRIQAALDGLNADQVAILFGQNAGTVTSNDPDDGDFSFEFNFTGGADGHDMEDFLAALDIAVSANIPTPEDLSAEVSAADRLAASNAERKFHIGANAGQQVAISIADSTSDALFGTTAPVASEEAAAAIVNDASANAAQQILSMVQFSDGSENAATGNEEASLADAVIAAITSTEAFAVTTGDNTFEVSIADARNMAISAIEHAISSVSERRSDLGALQNRLEHTIRNLDVASENLLSAESRIRDVDMASEVMEQTRTNILQQAAQSMLAMANQQPQSVLQLLG